MTKFTVIFCDDIRQEVSGKHIIIGAYSGNLVPTAVPSTFPIAIMVKVQELSGEHNFLIRLISPSGEVALEIEDQIEIPPDAGGFPLLFLGTPMTISEYGEIVLEFAFDGEAVQRIANLSVQAPE